MLSKIGSENAVRFNYYDGLTQMVIAIRIFFHY